MRIPQVLAKLTKMSEKFDAEHNVEEILVDGLRPDNYAAAILEKYEHDKEIHRKVCNTK